MDETDTEWPGLAAVDEVKECRGVPPREADGREWHVPREALRLERRGITARPTQPRRNGNIAFHRPGKQRERAEGGSTVLQ